MGRKKGPYAQTVRCLLLLRLLSSGNCPIAARELTRKFQVTPRQLRRDLAMLERAGYDLVQYENAGTRAKSYLVII